MNLSCFLYGAGDARIEDRALPAIVNEYDVIVQMAYVGVCGSDVHFWKHGGIGTKVDAAHPIVMGHEGSGVIHEVGSGVTSVSVGDAVAIEPGTPCRRCKACKAGSYNLCSSMKFAAAPPDGHGLLTKYYLIPEDFVYKLTSGAGLQEAVLVEPLAVAVHANRLVDVKAGQDVVIFGSGTVGLLSAAVAKTFGARPILVDVVDHKLKFAKDYLGCETFLSIIGDSPEVIAGQLRDTFDISEAVIQSLKLLERSPVFMLVSTLCVLVAAIFRLG